MKRWAVLALMVFVCSGCWDNRVHSKSETPVPSITVQGQGKALAEPDEAVTSFGVTSEAKTLERAYQGNVSKMNTVIQTVKDLKVEGKDIQTSSFSVTPVYLKNEHGQNISNEIIGFTVRQELTVTVRDLTKIGDLIDRVIAGGTNVFHGIQFSSSKMDLLTREAKQLAARDAKTNAKLLAESLDVKLGRLLNASDSYAQPYPIRGMKMQMMEAAFAPQIEAGSLEIVATCNAVYEILE